MMDIKIVLGDGEVGVGVSILKKEMLHCLSFSELVSPYEIGSNVRGKDSYNRISLIIKNKESLAVVQHNLNILSRPPSTSLTNDFYTSNSSKPYCIVHTSIISPLNLLS